MNIPNLDAQVAQAFQNQVSDDLAPFYSDPSYYVKCQEILENSQTPTTLAFASLTLRLLVNANSLIWDVERLESICQWIPAFLQNKIELLFSIDEQTRNIIIPNLAEIYSKILFKFWNANSKLVLCFQKVDSMMPDIDPPHRILRYTFFKTIILESAKYPSVKQKIITDKADTGLSDLFREITLNNLGKPDLDPVLILSCLDLGQIILDYYTKSMNEGSKMSKGDDLESEKCDLTIDFSDVIANPEFINSMFLFISNNITSNKIAPFTVKALEICYSICSLKTSYFPKKADQVAVMSVLCERILFLLQNKVYNYDNDIFLKLSIFLYKFSTFISIDISMTIQEIFHNLLNTAQAMTDEKLADDIIFENTNAIVNLMKFWCKVVSKKLCGANTGPVLTLFQKYIVLLVQSATQSPEEMISVLNVETGTICEAINIVPGMLKEDFSGLGDQVLQIAAQTFEDYKKAFSQNSQVVSKYDIIMSALVLLITAGIKSPISIKQTNQRNIISEFEKKSIMFIFDVYKTTGDMLLTIIQSQALHLELSLYLFAKFYGRSDFASFEFLAEQQTESPNYFNFIIRRLTKSLIIGHALGTDSKLIINNLSALQKLFDHISQLQAQLMRRNDFNGNLFCMVESSIELLDCLINGKFEFMSDFHFKREIILFMNICTNIVVNIPQKINEFLASVDAKFQQLREKDDSLAILIFIYQLIGIFDSQKSDTFAMFFNWIFPAKLELLVQIAPAIVSEPTVTTSYLKFWYKLISPDVQSGKDSKTYNKRDKIPISQHSPNGIILFTYISRVLVAFFNYIEAKDFTQSQDYHETVLRPLKNAMLLMGEIMSAENIMFGAFELYHDDTLNNLINAFISVSKKITFDDVFQNKNVATAFSRLIDALCKNHLMSIIKVNESFFDQIIVYVNIGLAQLTENIDSLVEAGKNMSSFLLSNKDDQIVFNAILRNQQQITRIIMTGFEFLFYDIKANEYNLLNMMKNLLTFTPNLISGLCEVITPQVPSDRLPEFTSRFQELNKSIQEMSPYETFRKIITDLADFSKKLYLKLPQSQ